MDKAKRKEEKKKEELNKLKEEYDEVQQTTKEILSKKNKNKEEADPNEFTLNR